MHHQSGLQQLRGDSDHGSGPRLSTDDLLMHEAFELLVRTHRDLFESHGERYAHYLRSDARLLPSQWQQQHANFTFIPVLSEPKADDGWPGRTGFVHQAVLDDFKDLSGYQVYACGAPPMIDAARKAFVHARGLPADEFFADSFTYAAEAEARIRG